MKIYTSYYASTKLRGVDRSALHSISNSIPDWFGNIDKIKELAPIWKYVKAFKDNLITWDEFSLLYTEQLDGLGIDNIKTLLVDKDVYLCYEKNQCHRFILGEYLCKNGVFVYEL